MPYAEPRSLQQIKRETEQTRAGLTETVEQLRTGVTEAASDLRERIRPEAIKAEVSDYIKSRGEQLLNDVTAAARRNPMQAVAVGASVAYPLLRLARSTPMPILMVGAGLFFAGSKTGQAAVRKASEVASDFSDEAMGRARDFGNQVGDTVSAAKTYASERIDQVSAAVSGGTDQASRAAGAAAATTASASRTCQDKASSFGASVSDRARDAKNSGVSMASSAAETLQDIASGAASAGRRTIGTVAEAGLDAAKAARQKASDLTERTGLDPDAVGMFAGALVYTQYGWFKRHMMRAIVKHEGGDLDMSKDYEYTDWDAVTGFAKHVDAIVNTAASR